ncbi:unnamed protein product [marine sediment metagenome]|uniref:Uncharacterized protein n=1 Tax=marine sediment metagenome TaxID=412755 RepID=X1LLH2_9ZZZZ
MSRAIDLLVEAAELLDSRNNDTELWRIRKKAMSMDKDNKYNSEDGLDATLNYHTINMRSRFRDIINKDKNNNNIEWKTEPYFYWVDRGIYRLLKSDEKEIFKIAVENDLDIIYKDFYSMYQLKNKVKKIIDNTKTDFKNK